MSMNVRTPPSPNYPTTPTASSSSTAAPPSSASAQLTALAVAMETLKTALGALPPAGGQGPAVPQGPAGEAQAGVSSFAPTSAPGNVSAASGVRGASAPGGADAGLAATPMGKAQGALAQEQQRLQSEKYNFPPHIKEGAVEHNQKLDEKNAKVQEKLTKLDADIAAERAGGGDSKKLKKMEEERTKVAGELKPPFDPAKITSEIDAVMNDPEIPEKDRKGKLDDIRKKYDLPEHGGSMSMDTMTRHLSEKTKESKDRVGKLQDSHMKQLDGQIKQAKETYGKDSPQVKALEEQKKGADGLYGQQKDMLGAQSDMLWNSFRKVGFFEKVGNFFKGIGNAIAAPFKAIGNVVKGVAEGVGKLFKGDIGGAFSSAFGGVKKGIGNLVDGAKATVSNLGNLVSFVSPKLGEKINGFTTGLVDGVGNLAKGAFDTVTSIPQGLANGAGKLLKGDVAGAFGEVGKGVKNAAETGFKTVNDGLPLIATAAAFVPGLQPIAIPLAVASSVKGAVEAGQRGDTLGVVASLAGGVAGGAGAMAARGASGAATAGSAAARSAPAASGGAAAAGGAAARSAPAAGGAAAASGSAAAGGAAARSAPAAGSTATAGSTAATGGASANRWNNVALGAELVEAGANTAKGIQEGDYFGAVGSAAGGVSKGATAMGDRRKARADAAPQGSAAQNQANASANRWNNVALGADMVGAGANTAKSLQEGDYFGAAGAAAGGVSKGATAMGDRRKARADAAPQGSAAQNQANASANRWNNVALGADLAGAGANTAKSLQEGDYFGAAGAAAGGVSKGATAMGDRRKARADAAPQGGVAQNQANASANRWNNVALGADLVGAGANTAKGLQEGDYFGAASAAAGGVSKGASAFKKTDATTTPATTTPPNNPTKT
ncbi:hypothetical protein CYFUS_008531 [Cystobacter fuscus]|uniref:Uncharacterized protein n=1 Tax=Cystobacter fuscus TaxID=43 RepID=A0A250JHU6_9BACT|nr:hypothetical protein [Cystobacter fuscus]ATB43052.1 hypothetical protein CYFUS_008531 [Cystobacter fuscus]